MKPITHVQKIIFIMKLYYYRKISSLQTFEMSKLNNINKAYRILINKERKYEQQETVILTDHQTTMYPTLKGFITFQTTKILKAWSKHCNHIFLFFLHRKQMVFIKYILIMTFHPSNDLCYFPFSPWFEFNHFLSFLRKQIGMKRIRINIKEIRQGNRREEMK